MASRREPSTLSAARLGVLMLMMGAPADEDVIATGIGVCTAESGRRRKAKNRSGNTPPSTDRGPWQINDHWHPEVSDACAYSWPCATKAALTISSNGSNWSAWTTYHAGIGAPYRAAARRAIKASKGARGGSQMVVDIPGVSDLWDGVKNLFGPDLFGRVRELEGGDSSNPVGGLDPKRDIPGVGAAVDGLEGLANFLLGLGELILTPEGWIRLGKMLFGVIALIAGVNILIRETTGVNVGKTATSVAGAVAPVPV